MGAALGKTAFQQPTQSSGKGAGGRSAFNQQMMNVPGFADSLQASQQRMAQDPYANMMRTQPAQPQGPMSIDDFARSGQTQQPMNQIGDMRFMQPSQTSMQAQLASDAQMRPNHPLMRAQSYALQGRRQAPPMSIPQPQQMNEQIRMQQMMQQRQMPFQMQPQMNNFMFGGLGALMAMRGFGGGFGQPMGGFGGGYAPPQFGGGFGGRGGGGFSQPQMGSPFGASMSPRFGGLIGFLGRQRAY